MHFILSWKALKNSNTWENLQKFSSKTDRMYDESLLNTLKHFKNTLKHKG